MSTNLRIEVRTGEAERTRVDFAPGTSVDPFSVGRAASWVVKSHDVADVHAYLYFDGTTLFVASVGGAPVTMAGQSVGADWEPVDVPMNIHLGGAKLAVRGPTSHRAGQEATKPRADIAVPDEDEKTQFQPVPNTVRHGPKGVEVARRTDAPAFDAPADSEATVVQRQEETRPRAPRPPPPTAEPESERTRIAPVEARVPGFAAGSVAGSAAPHAGAHPSFASSPEVSTAPAPLEAPQAAPPPPMAGAPPPTPMHASMPGGPPGAPGAPPGAVPGFVVQHGQAPQAPPVPGGPGQPAESGAGLAKLKAQAKKAWGDASVPQKAILVLLPFAFIAMFSLMGGQSANKSGAATSKSAAPVASVAAPGSSSVAKRAAPSAQPAPSAAAPAPVAAVASAPSRSRTPRKKAHGGKTDERLAVDAVAAGNFEDALKKYEGLAEAHPDRPVYKQAVRILKSKIAAQ